MALVWRPQTLPCPASIGFLHNVLPTLLHFRTRTANTTSTDYTIQGLQPNTDYLFKVWAYNRNGRSEQPKVIHFYNNVTSRVDYSKIPYHLIMVALYCCHFPPKSGLQCIPNRIMSVDCYIIPILRGSNNTACSGGAFHCKLETLCPLFMKVI